MRNKKVILACIISIPVIVFICILVEPFITSAVVKQAMRDLPPMQSTPDAVVAFYQKSPNTPAPAFEGWIELDDTGLHTWVEDQTGVTKHIVINENALNSMITEAEDSITLDIFDLDNGSKYIIVYGNYKSRTRYANKYGI